MSITGSLPVRFCFVVERIDSEWLRWDISDDESEVLDKASGYPIKEDVQLFATNTLPLPENAENAAVGDRFKIEGTGDMVFEEAFNGEITEYDSHFDGELTATPLPAADAAQPAPEKP